MSDALSDLNKTIEEEDEKLWEEAQKRGYDKIDASELHRRWTLLTKVIVADNAKIRELKKMQETAEHTQAVLEAAIKHSGG